MSKKIDYRVVYCSGSDEDYPGTALEQRHPQAKGWQSQRFCSFPQELTVQLSGIVRLRKIQLLSHQYKIPTKVELFIANVSDDTQLPSHGSEGMHFKRLGYVSLSSNDATEFKCRELKSVHVDAVGQFLQLIVHKNHINKHNLYNQVGLVAVNVIGDIQGTPGFQENFSVEALYPNIVMDQNHIGEQYANVMPHNNVANVHDPDIWGMVNRPARLNPLDDLSFEMYQDPETARIIKTFAAQKEAAVRSERYEEAKHLKLALVILERAGEELARLEIKKRSAVDSEDYDLAREMKFEIDDFRAKLYAHVGAKREHQGPPLPTTTPLPQVTHETKVKGPTERIDTEALLKKNTTELSEIEPDALNVIEPDFFDLPLKKTTAAVADSPSPAQVSVTVNDDRPSSTSHSPEKERPLSTSSKHPHHEERPVDGSDGYNVNFDDEDPFKQKKKFGKFLGTPEVNSRVNSAKKSYLRRKSPRNRACDDSSPSSVKEAKKVNNSEGTHNAPEAINDNIRKDAQDLIVSFGDHITACVYSRLFSHRLEAVELVIDSLSHFESGSEKSEMMLFLGAAYVVRKLLSDTVLQVFSAGLNLFYYLLDKWAMEYSISKASRRKIVENVVSLLISRCGDISSRLRDASFEGLIHIGEISGFGAGIVCNPSILPMRKMNVVRTCKGRIELLVQLLQKFGLGNNRTGLTVNYVVDFLTPFFNNTSGDVREAAVRASLTLYKISGAAAAEAKEAFESISLSGHLRGSLETGFAKIDGKPESRIVIKGKKDRQGDDGEAEKLRVVKMLQEELAELRSMAAVKLDDRSKESRRQNTVHKDSAVKGAKRPSQSISKNGSASPLPSKHKTISQRHAKLPKSNTSMRKRNSITPMEVSEDNVTSEISSSSEEGSPPMNRRVDSEDIINSSGGDGVHEKRPESGTSVGAMCIFCGAVNDTFVREEALDIHFWKECPMLVSCSQCKQIVEIAMLNEHLLTECEKQLEMKSCERCQEPVHIDKLDAHIKSQKCLVAQPLSMANRCPLCHYNIPPGDDGWRNHLMSSLGCKFSKMNIERSDDTRKSVNEVSVKKQKKKASPAYRKHF